MRHLVLLALPLLGCATSTPGAKPHDMSAAEHRRQAAVHDRMADEHSAQCRPSARYERTRCSGTIGHQADFHPEVCWTSLVNPTEKHRQEAATHRRQAADHRAASKALRDAEDQSCAGLDESDRDLSPFEHTEDIASVAPLRERTESRSPVERTAGAVVTFRAVPGMTPEWLQRVVDCHLARNAALGHSVPEMPTCPLVPKGATATVRSTGNGFAVEIRGGNAASAREIWARAKQLSPGQSDE